MRIRMGRIFVIAILAEILANLALVVIVALFGPADPAAAQAYAESTGFWVGPLAGFAFTLIGGWWIARSLANSQVLNGFALGVAVALIDISILVMSGAEFLPVFVYSNVGRIFAGSLGGWLAGRVTQRANEPSAAPSAGQSQQTDSPGAN